MKYPPFFLDAVITFGSGPELGVVPSKGARKYRTLIVLDCAVVELKDMERLEDMEILVSAYPEGFPDMQNAFPRPHAVS